MRPFVTLLLIIFSSICLFAEERNIELQERKAELGARSLNYKPAVSYDGNILYIHSEIPLENLQVSVTDLYSGITIYYTNITVINNLPYTLQPQNIGIGNYLLELNIGQKSYYGYFEVTP